MQKQFTFSELAIERLDEALALMREVFLGFEALDYSDEGIQEFKRYIEPEAIKDKISERKMRIWVCESGDSIVGALAAGCNHINLLFVRGQYHRQGIARQLFNMMTACYNSSYLTVHASPYAVGAYKRLGFVSTDAEQAINGLRFTPMRWAQPTSHRE